MLNPASPAAITAADLPPADRPAAAVPRWIRGLMAGFVAITFILITTGGLVTSYNAGMAVPDWPASFGKWLLLPIYLWRDLAIFLEHNHRLTGMVGGLAAIAALIAVWPRTTLKPARTLAVVVLALYIVQGLLGGFRVTEVSTTLAILHGVHGQIVFGLVVALATLVWAARHPITERAPAWTITLAGVFLALIIAQLTLGAVVRHTHSASAIPDAPAVYGSWIPPIDDTERAARFAELGGTEWVLYEEEPAIGMEALETEQTPDLLENTAVTYATSPSLAAVMTHYSHRVMGMLALPVALVALLLGCAKAREGLSGLRGPAGLLLGLFAVQVALGLSVIWSKENPAIATGHQAVGAALLGTTVWLLVRLFVMPVREPQPEVAS